MAGGRQTSVNASRKWGRRIPGQTDVITPPTVVHHGLRCTKYHSKYEQGPDPSEPVWKEALRWLATKRGLLSSAHIDELGTVPFLMWWGVTTTELSARKGRPGLFHNGGNGHTRTVDSQISEENTQGEGDPEMMGLEDITAEAREVEFGWLRSSDPQLHSSYRTRCATSERLAQYGKGLFCDPWWGSRQFVTKLIDLGPGTPLRFCESVFRGKIRRLEVYREKIKRFSHLPLLPPTANPGRTRRNCHLPGRSLREQLPPTLITSRPRRSASPSVLTETLPLRRRSPPPRHLPSFPTCRVCGWMLISCFLSRPFARKSSLNWSPNLPPLQLAYPPVRNVPPNTLLRKEPSPHSSLSCPYCSGEHHRRRSKQALCRQTNGLRLGHR